MDSVEFNMFEEFAKQIFGEDQELGSSQASKEYIVSRARIIKLNKGEYLQIEGDVSKFWGYVIKGLVRVYYNHQEEEVTEILAIDGDDFLDVESYFDQKPSTRFIQMLEPTTLYIFRKMDFDEAVSSNLEIRRFFRIATEKILLRKKKRTEDSIFKSAKERFEALLENKSNLVLRTPSNIIASYLGITPETLSRIKSKTK